MLLYIKYKIFSNIEGFSAQGTIIYIITITIVFDNPQGFNYNPNNYLYTNMFYYNTGLNIISLIFYYGLNQFEKKNCSKIYKYCQNNSTTI